MNLDVPIKKRLRKLVLKFPGLTACEYTKLMKHPSYYGKTSVLRQLHREVEKGNLVRVKEPGVRKTVPAWRFYLAVDEDGLANFDYYAK